MTYSEAMQAAENGMRIRRKAWPHGRHLVYQKESIIKPEQERKPSLQHLGSKPIYIEARLDLIVDFQESASLVAGWAPTETDSRRADWEVME